MTIDQYITNINNRYQQGNATEHTFRGDLQQLIESIVPTVVATNEPKRQQCGAPDYILTKKDIPVGFIEAKDIGDTDLAGTKKTGNKEQFDRYKASLSNIIFTDYLDFHLYRDGQFVTSIKIAEATPNPSKGGAIEIVPVTNNYSAFTNLLKDFCTHISQTIKSPKRLAEMMAGKARLLSDVIENALNDDNETQENSTLKEQMNAFKQILIHDITPKAFADVYAQTIAYGMFAARLHDPTLPTFSRQEAAELIPKTNPFLRKLFGYIAGPDIDDRIKWIVDSLVEIFLACNVEEILKGYGKTTKTEDPIIHFYETFLSEYDPKLRKARGVWYTPAPVVNFIVRAVDDILKTEFNLPQGLADTSKTKIKVNLQATDKRYTNNIKTVEEEVHRVQILDPATGTGTFLAEVVKHIHKKFAGQQGIWSNYVQEHLLPRLNGFELLMASYAMAHLQLDLLLKETGVTSLQGTDQSLRGTKQSNQQRLRVYLTNSLEESHPDTGTLFANWLSSEANEANRIKRDAPVMCVIGNPPYAVSSNNKNEWIQNLIVDYKKNLNERKINLDDDYIKFIRYGQHFIDKNGSGVLAYISNNSFIDGITHRQMRRHLLESFDSIYILDLHGNAKKKEVCADGSADQNVFDIMQGVSINIFIKTGKKKKGELGEVKHFDLQGKRDAKYDFLNENNLKSIDWNKLDYTEPNLFFVPKNFDDIKEYEKGFKIDELFNYYNSGLQTKNDELTIHFTSESLNNVLSNLKIMSNDELKRKYSIGNDGRDWTIAWAKKDVIESKNGKQFMIQYKPFDFRYSYYTGNSKGFIAYPRKQLTNSLINDNLALATMRQIAGSTEACQILLTKYVLTDRAMYSTNGTPYLFPLYLYPEKTEQLSLGQPTPNPSTGGELQRVPNLNMAIVDKIAKDLQCLFVEDDNICVDLSAEYKDTIYPTDILDYIYAVLHSPSYREKYKEFLKIDFPRVPYPKDLSTFNKLTNLGSQLRQIHLLESEVVENYITQYPVDGSNVVEKPLFVISNEERVRNLTDTNEISRQEPRNDEKGNTLAVTGNVYINDTQYFANVPQVAWEFYIGGYQPAQKWLKDRKGRALGFEDILHYQKIIVALTETDRLMKEIDGVEI